MKQNLKPGDVISFPSLEEMCPQYARTERHVMVDDKLSLTDIYKINVVKNGVPTSIELRSNIRYISRK